MTDYPKALADARDALAIYLRYGPPHYGEPLCGYATNAIDALDDLLAALDAAQPVARLYTLEYGPSVVDRMASDCQLNYPFGVCGADYQRANGEGVSYVRESPLYLAPQAPPAAVPPERDWTMLQSGDVSVPTWVVRYANAIGAYMKGQNVQHWAVGPIQSHNEAPPAALAVVPEGYALVPVEPTKAMLSAARDWSLKKYGQAVGNDGARGCYAAMLAADAATLAAERNKEGG